MSDVIAQAAAAGQHAAGDHDDRWFGVGYSTATDGHAAGVEATGAALAGRPDAALVLVFSRDSLDLDRMIEGVRSRSGGGARIAGCSTIEPMASGGDRAEPTVSVLAFGGSGFGCEVAVSRDVPGRERAAGTEAAAGLARLDHPHRALLLFVDGLLMNNPEIVRGAYAAAGATVPLVGGCASDNWDFTRTYQFAGDGDGVEILSGAVVGVAIGSPAPVGLGMAHGWRRSGEPMVVTDSDELKVYELDNEPALDVFLRRAGLDQSVVEGSEAFRLRALECPLGVAGRSGDEIRVIQGVDPSDNSLLCSAGIPRGGVTWVMESDPDALVASAAESCRNAVATLGGAQPLGLLTFDCAVRRREMGPDGVRREIEEIGRAFPGIHFGGFYSYGEIARYRGAAGMHHMTLVALAFA